MDYSYLLCPFVALLTAGIIKFCINSIRAKKLAFGLIGYGGLPSNHSAIVSSMATLVALKEGIHHPAFGVALALAFIVVLDASSLRRQVGKHATLLNHLAQAAGVKSQLRERMGHTLIEIIAGIGTGALVALAISKL